MRKRYIVELTKAERESLQEKVKKGRMAAYKIKHANVLLAADVRGPGMNDKRIAEAFSCHVCTVENVRRRFVLKGLEAALVRKQQERPSRAPKLDGKGEARLIALACSEPPESRDSWTLELLADKLVRLKVVDSISGQTVRRVLKKTRCGRTCKSVG